MLSIRVVEVHQVNLRNKETCKIINFPVRKKIEFSIYSLKGRCYMCRSWPQEPQMLRDKFCNCYMLGIHDIISYKVLLYLPSI